MNHKTIISIVFASLLAQNILVGQILITDTIISHSYGCYYEEIKICKTLIPDSTFILSIDEREKTKNSQIYQSQCFNAVSTEQGFHSFEDFLICFDTDCFKFNYPSYIYNLDRNILIESLDNIHIKSSKNKSVYYPKELDIKFADGTTSCLTRSNLESDSLKLNLKRKLYKIQLISVKVPSFTYPYNSPLKDCGQNLITFVDQDFWIKGKCKYLELCEQPTKFK